MKMKIALLATAFALAASATQASTHVARRAKAKKTKGSKSAPSGPINGCSFEDRLYFSDTYAEMVDLMSDAAQALALRIETGRRADPPNNDGVMAYLSGNRTDAEAEFAAFMDDVAAPDFTASVTSYRRTVNFEAPVIQIPYPSLATFLSGMGTPPDDFVPGFYAILPFRGMFLNPNGGSMGYAKCDGLTATTTVRTIDVFIAVGLATDLGGDGTLDNESAIAKILMGWEYSEGQWGLKTLDLIADQLGYTSFGSYIAPSTD